MTKSFSTEAKLLLFSIDLLIWSPPCTTVNPTATVKTLWDQPISRVEYIRIELHNPAFFITSSTAFVIERAFQPRNEGEKKEVAKTEKLGITFNTVSLSARHPPAKSAVFCSTSQYTSLLVPYERGFVRSVPNL